jgi:quinol monooxygenase YgiN
MVEREQSEKRTEKAEKSPRPSSAAERAPTSSEKKEVEALDAELASLDKAIDDLRQGFKATIGDVHSSLENWQKISLAEAFQDKQKLNEELKDPSVDALTAAKKKLVIYSDIMIIVDGAKRKIQTGKEEIANRHSRDLAKAAPKGGESYVPKAEEAAVEEEASVEEDSSTNLIENTPDRSELEPESESGAEPEVEESEGSPEENVEKDDNTQQWERWLDENESVLESIGAISDGFIGNKEAFMQASGLGEGDLASLESIVAGRETAWKAEADRILKDAKANGFVDDLHVWTGNPADVKSKYDLDDVQYMAVMKRIGPALDRKAA